MVKAERGYLLRLYWSQVLTEFARGNKEVFGMYLDPETQWGILYESIRKELGVSDTMLKNGVATQEGN